MKPITQISINGNPVTLAGRLISLTMIDKNGIEADEITLIIDDSDSLVELPKKGVTLSAAFGFSGQLTNQGDYIVDEVNHGGPPDVITVRARSADFRASLLEQRETSYDNATLGEIVKAIAASNELEAVINDELANKPIAHLDQTNESDGNLLTRLAKQYYAVATVKSGKLLFIKRGSGKTAGGNPLPQVTINRSMGDTHRYREADRDAQVTGIKAYWQDINAAKRKEVIIGEDKVLRTLEHTYASEQEASAAADSELKYLQSRARQLDLTLAYGRVDIIAEQPLKAVGFKTQIDEVNWFICEITHTINDQGYTCTVKCEEMIL